VLKEAQMMKEAAVGNFREWEDRRTPSTLLLALPPAGRMTFAAMQSQRQVDRVAEMFSVGIVFTVYPDAWHKHQAQERYNASLEFLDPEPTTNPFHLSGSRLAGPSRSSARSRQPFLNGGA
jgi:hypothetical protein